MGTVAEDFSKNIKDLKKDAAVIWSLPKYLVISDTSSQQSTTEAEAEKYFSPFSGKWT